MQQARQRRDQRNEGLQIAADQTADHTGFFFVGQLFKVIGSHPPPPPTGLKSPALWSTETHLVELLGPQAADILRTRKLFNFRYRWPAHWLQIFRNYYLPTHKAFAALDANGQVTQERDIVALLQWLNVAGESSLVVPAEYLEVVIRKHG